MKNFFVSLLVLALVQACGNKKEVYDASGSFEADEVVVSSELGGQLIQLKVEEGDTLNKGQIVGVVDSTSLTLQKEQVKATIASLSEKPITYSHKLNYCKNNCRYNNRN